MYLVTADEMQKMDKDTIETFGIPGRVLMENAGRGAFDMLMRQFPDIVPGKVGVIAGRGNNGGDAFVVARYLAEKNVTTTVFLLSAREKLKGDADANFALVEKLARKHAHLTITEMPDEEAFDRHKTAMLHHDLFVDGVLGTGLTSDVKGFFRDVIEWLNQSGRPVFSIDIPSGLDADTGRVCGVAVKADATATFAHAKAGHVLQPGKGHTGVLEVVDIGIPAYITEAYRPRLHLIEEGDITKLFPPRNSEAHKGNFGHLLVIAGSPGKTGAAALAANAAVRCGTGLVTVGVPESTNTAVEPQVTEAMTHPLAEDGKGRLSAEAADTILALAADKSAVAFGPGVGTAGGTGKLLKRLLAELRVPVIIDADGLNLLAREPEILKQSPGDIIITPHPGEMARLTGLPAADIQKNRVDTARNFAGRYGVTVVLKGAGTVISQPDGTAAISPSGNPGMASGGMGDVLTGMIAGFAAQGFSAGDAAFSGVYIHGICGDLLKQDTGGFGYLASDMIRRIPEAIHKELLC